jgi:hypothetical protein
MGIKHNNQTWVECEDDGDILVEDEYGDSNEYPKELHIVTNANNITINHRGGRGNTTIQQSTMELGHQRMR